MSSTRFLKFHYAGVLTLFAVAMFAATPSRAAIVESYAGALVTGAGAHTATGLARPLDNNSVAGIKREQPVVGAPIRLAQITFGGGRGFQFGGNRRFRNFGRGHNRRLDRHRPRFRFRQNFERRFRDESRRNRYRDRDRDYGRYRDRDRRRSRERDRYSGERRRNSRRAQERRRDKSRNERRRATERAKREHARKLIAERQRKLRRDRARKHALDQTRRLTKIRDRIKHRRHAGKRLRRLRLAILKRWRDRCGPGRPHGGRPGVAGVSSVGGRGAHTGRPGKRPGGHRPCGPRGPGGTIVLVPPVVIPPFVQPDDPGRSPPDRIITPQPPRIARPPVTRPPSGQPPAGTPPAAVADDRTWPGQIVAQIDRFSPVATDDAIARDYNLVRITSETNLLVGRRIVLYRIPDQRTVQTVTTALAADQRVSRAQPNYRYELNETLQPASAPGLQYALTRIRLAGAHTLAKGNGVKLAVIDSGIDEGHSGLKDSVASRFDATRGHGQRADETRKVDAHGTAIAGIIRARGMAQGIAPDARLLAARAFIHVAGFTGPQSRTMIMLRALDWSVSSGARVINMSFAGPRDGDVAEAIEMAARKGIVLVAAAGNGGATAKPAYPAAYKDVIAVTATDADDKLYDKANQGTYVAVAAPGVDVFVLAPGNSHKFSSGTSFAAAHVSGLVALMLERNRNLDIETIREALMRTARDLGQAGIDAKFGAGRVDAEAVLQAIPEVIGPAVSIAKRDR